MSFNLVFCYITFCFPMLSDFISNITNQVLCLVIGRVRLVFGYPEVIPHMEEAQGVVTGSSIATLKHMHNLEYWESCTLAEISENLNLAAEGFKLFACLVKPLYSRSWQDCSL